MMVALTRDAIAQLVKTVVNQLAGLTHSEGGETAEADIFLESNCCLPRTSTSITRVTKCLVLDSFKDAI